MRFILLLLITFVSWKTYSQESEFLNLIDKFSKEKTLLDSLTAKKFIGVDYKTMRIQAFTDKIVFRNTFYIGLSFSFPCPAGAICDRSLLIVYDYNGIKVDKLPDFEYEFADCASNESQRCIYSSDSLLVLVRQELKSDCELNKILYRNIYVETYQVDQLNGMINDPNIDTVDLRRKYYNLSSQLVDKELLLNTSKDELAVMRNEIFASHGYIFKNTKWIDYFSQLDWYKPEYDDVNERLTYLENSNLKLILELEKKK